MQTLVRIVLAALFSLGIGMCPRCTLEAAPVPCGDDIAVTGGTTVVQTGEPIESTELVSFALEYDSFGMYPDDSARSALCHQGRYSAQVNQGEDGRVHCELTYRRPYDDDVIAVEFWADASALEELQAALDSGGFTQINGFSASNSALGVYVDVRADYASGEHLSVHGEGGASAAPPADVDGLVVCLNQIAEQNGLRYTRMYTENEVVEALGTWAMRNAPDVPPLDGDNVTVTCNEYGEVYTVRICYWDDERLWYIDADVDALSGIASEVFYRAQLDGDDPVDVNVEGTVDLFGTDLQ